MIWYRQLLFWFENHLLLFIAAHILMTHSFSLYYLMMIKIHLSDNDNQLQTTSTLTQHHTTHHNLKLWQHHQQRIIQTLTDESFFINFNFFKKIKKRALLLCHRQLHTKRLALQKFWKNNKMSILFLILRNDVICWKPRLHVV